MAQESIVYTINLSVGLVLAVLMTLQWRLEAAGANLRTWILAAWVLTGADLLFALRPELPHWVGRFFPTLIVTVGHAVLLVAARRTADLTPRKRLIGGLVVAHAAALVAFLIIDSTTPWRTVTNGIFWGSLSVASAGALWRAADRVRQALLATALVFLAQGVFHLGRIALAATLATQDPGENPVVQLLGDIEVSLFMVALFVSVLIAHLRLRNAELRAALQDVRQLSSLLPICAWCRKVRDDSGYWTQIEQYLDHHHIKVTHSICESCAAAADRDAGAPAA